MDDEDQDVSRRNSDNRTKEQLLKEEREEKQSSQRYCWIAQVVVWISFGVFIVPLVLYGRDMAYQFWMQFLFVYLFYMYFCLCRSDTFSFIRHVQKGVDIYSYMGSLFYSPVSIDFSIKCYHVTVGYRKKRRTYVTHEAKTSFKYFSCRDISGPFELKKKTKGQVDPSRCLVKLKLGLSVEFPQPDDGTAVAYEYQKDCFINSNKRDSNQSFQKKSTIKGFETFSLVSTNGQNTPFISLELYVLSSILMFVEIYKLYVEKHCIEEEFEIKKLVSTTQDLNKPENFQPHIHRTPTLKIGEIVYFNDMSKLTIANEMPDHPGLDYAKQEEIRQRIVGVVGPGPDIDHSEGDITSPPAANEESPPPTSSHLHQHNTTRSLSIKLTNN